MLRITFLRSLLALTATGALGLSAMAGGSTAADHTCCCGDDCQCEVCGCADGKCQGCGCEEGKCTDCKCGADCCGGGDRCSK
jgi:hypothetical protein